MAIDFVGWRTYPTLNSDKKYLYYATDVSWNGVLQTNIKATVFDRSGYVAFEIVPMAADLSSAAIESLINDTLDRYVPAPNQSYAAFQNGDKVAAVGAMGVLAGLVGVKYGKAAVAGFTAIALVLLKKAWLLVLLPILWIVRLFRARQPQK